MSRAEFYRSEANRCRTQALTCRDPDDARRWGEIAQGYADVAERFEGFYRIVRDGIVLRRGLVPAE